MTTTSMILTSCIVWQYYETMVNAQHDYNIKDTYFLYCSYSVVLKVVVFISHDIRHMTTKSRKRTFCIVHNYIHSDSIKKPWLMHNMTTSMILTICIVHNCIQSGSIHEP